MACVVVAAALLSFISGGLSAYFAGGSFLSGGVATVGAMLTFGAKAAISGAVICGIIGGLVSATNGNSFWNGAVSGFANGLIDGFALGCAMFAVFSCVKAVIAGIKVANTSSVKIGYHATKPEYAASIKKNGFRESKSGRAGGGGVYINNTPEGAIAEYIHYNPNAPAPTVLKVQYNPGNQVKYINLGEHIYGSILPDADTIIFESIRAPGTYNILVKNGSIVLLG